MYKISKSEKIQYILANYLQTVKPIPARIIIDKKIEIKFLSDSEILIKKEFLNEPNEESEIYELTIKFDKIINLQDQKETLLHIVVNELDQYIAMNPCSFVSSHLPHDISDCSLIHAQ